jgi:hypothetical protein
MSDAVLTVLKFCLLALLYLFLLRVVWIVARELRGSPAPVPAPRPCARPRCRTGRTAAKLALVVVEPATEKGHEYAIDGEATFGRGGGCTVRLGFDTFVSQVHAFERDGSLWVEDAARRTGRS